MRKIFIPAFLLLAIVSAIIVNSFTNSKPHQFKEGQCGFCHLNYDQPLRFRDNVSTLCNYCHGKRNVLSHIVGINPSIQIPPDFHLDENGEMTCATCHRIHMDTVDPQSGERTYLLSTDMRGRELCDACHVNTMEVVQASTPSTHAGVLDTAHFGYYSGARSTIDKVSIVCLGCHDGSVGKNAQVITKTSHSLEGSHPIGINYMKSFRKNKDIRSPKALSPEIKLFEGKVGCTSCHNPFKLPQHNLNISNEESKLCFECHLK